MIDTSGNKPVIQVKMFGGCTITMDDKSMGDSDNRSRKAWNLLSYLIINRRKDVSINELFQAIWQDGMQDNPYGALKTLVFRVRKMMEAAGFPSQDLILNQKGAYMWNPSWELSIDTDRFEFLCRRILTSQEDMRDMEKEWKEALNLYRGAFLPKSADDSWVVPLNTYYHSLYQKLVKAVCGYLLDQQEYAQVEEICSRAAGIDRFAEDFYYYMIYAVYKQGNQKKALEQYKSTTELFYRERLITPSDRFKELYEIISDRQQEIITDLDVIQASLDCPGTIEEQREHGAYQCEYAVFKRLVQLERRGVERSGDSVYLCLLTVGDRRGRTLKPEIQARAMERLKGVINHSLRSSDAFSRYSVSQYIILLPSVTYENGEQVMRRIMSAFNKAYVRKDVAVTYSLNLILPKEDTIEA